MDENDKAIETEFANTSVSADAQGWRTIREVYKVPAKAKQAQVELRLRWAPTGKVEWRDAQVTAAEAPAARKVKVASINHRPRGNKTAMENLEQFASFVDGAGKNKADIQLFCTNLLNEGYYNHLSLIKAIGVKDMGRNIGFRFTMKFVKEKKEIEVPEGSNLRTEALKAGIHTNQGFVNGIGRWANSSFANCHGLGLCGTCRVLVTKGMENTNAMGMIENFRFHNPLPDPFPSLSFIGNEDTMRLSCKVQVLGDMEVETAPTMDLFGENFFS